MSTVANNYFVGQDIQSRDPSTGQWRRATVMKLSPYRGKPGYYIEWTDIPIPERFESWRSSGGWAYEACMRPCEEKTIA